ncbi:MAG: OmpH family outer membrane protein [Flavobacteriales bacterium]|nr:OmpH family outer membrane protein [Flavobacteriales bacterium]MCB9192398.1 OmpH family outer membrane protein [Flavobacteriales bacterium]MCB9204486.1 OmpH family outer membrane protein [Flavobacteriales bacterium]
MKKLIIAVIAIAFTFPALAQQKFGHIDSGALLELMPEKKKAETELEAFAKEFQTALEDMAKEYEGKVQTFQAEEKGMVATVRNTKMREIADLERRIQEFQQQAQEEIANKEQEVLTPIIDKARKAIDEIAKEKGYTYVFDSSLGVLLYADDSEDILADVKAKLGL